MSCVGRWNYVICTPELPPFLLVLSHASVLSCICKAFSVMWHAKMAGNWLNRQERGGLMACRVCWAMLCGMKVESGVNCASMSWTDWGLSMPLGPSTRPVFHIEGTSRLEWRPDNLG